MTDSRPDRTDYGTLDLAKPADVKLLRRAVREGWNVKATYKGQAIKALSRAIEIADQAQDTKAVAQAVGVLVQMDTVDQRDEHHQDRMMLAAMNNGQTETTYIKGLPQDVVDDV